MNFNVHGDGNRASTAMSDHQPRTVRRAAEDSARSARTSRGKTPPLARASLSASIQLTSAPVLSTTTVRADSPTCGRQSGSTRPAAGGGVLPHARRASSNDSAGRALARVSIGQKPAAPANSCERRDAAVRRETASQGRVRGSSRSCRMWCTLPRRCSFPRRRAVRGSGRFWPRFVD